MRDACKQERVDSMNYVYDTVFLRPVYLSFLQPNKSLFYSKRRLFRRHIVYYLY